MEGSEVSATKQRKKKIIASYRRKTIRQSMSEYETGSSDERASSVPLEASVSNIARTHDSEVFEKIKTHFPPAKIKKIMQTDEDIGKVSQATPVITGRSLEFFIALLVDRSSKMARDQGSKRISAEIMKKTIMSDEKFDFLREVVLPQQP